MKLWFRVPRPWVLDPNFTILEQAREAAAGYSFPSGHTQNAVGTFGALAITTKTRWIKVLSVALAVLVPFSRMYVGVHSPADVLVAAAMAVAFLMLLRPFIFRKDEGNVLRLLTVLTLLSAAFLCFVEFWNFPADIDHHNLQSGIKNAYTLIGSLVGLVIVYFVDNKYIRFETSAIWWVQILKVALGFLAVLAVKSGLKTPIEMICGGHMIARAIRYFLIVIMAGIIWPLTFQWLSKLGRK